MPKESPKDIQLKDVYSVPISDASRYNVSVTVTSLDEITTLQDGCRLQKAHLVDQSGSATITLWGRVD